jgi:hypothetical protein
MAFEGILPHLAGALGLLAIAGILLLVTGKSVAKLVEGKDGRASTSKFQLVVWTAVGLYSFVAVLASLVLHGSSANIDTVPPFLLTAMGLSVVTATAAKAVTSAQVNSSQVAKTPVGNADSSKDPGAAALVQDDSGDSDLSKTQLLAWTVIAVAVYGYRLIQQINLHPIPASGSVGLPEIDIVLVPLLGLGHAAYLGKKLTTSTVPQITGVTPSAGTPPRTVALTGAGFGAGPQGSGQILIDQTPYNIAASHWEDNSVVFDIPRSRVDGSLWKPGDIIRFSVVVAGQASGNEAAFTIATPRLSGMQPLHGIPPLSLEVTGWDLGTAQNGSEVLVNGQVVPVVIKETDWSDSKVTFDLDELQAGTGLGWPEGSSIQIGLRVSGRDVAMADRFLVKK